MTILSEMKENLLEKYPVIIEEMPDTFKSHKFILKFAQKNQHLYIGFLNHYIGDDPFMNVHREMARLLHKIPNIKKIEDNVSSTDIFGNSNTCSLWEKIE